MKNIQIYNYYFIYLNYKTIKGAEGRRVRTPRFTAIR